MTFSSSPFTSPLPRFLPVSLTHTHTHSPQVYFTSSSLVLLLETSSTKSLLVSFVFVHILPSLAIPHPPTHTLLHSPLCSSNDLTTFCLISTAGVLAVVGLANVYFGTCMKLDLVPKKAPLEQAMERGQAAIASAQGTAVAMIPTRPAAGGNAQAPAPYVAQQQNQNWEDDENAW